MSPGWVAYVFRIVLGVAAMLCSIMVCGVPAYASFGTIELQSAGPSEQAETAGEAALSADGRYLAFQGRLEGVQGVFRKDLQSGQIELVAGGNVYAPEGAALDASSPSISADGRYVSFDTGVALDPVDDTHTGTSVYVRDISVPVPATPSGACTAKEIAEEREHPGVKTCPYELASALDGSRQGLLYEGSSSGALASGRVALSAGGREVAFVIQGESNLTSGPSGSTPGTPTPGPQVAVRYLDTQRTVLVSAERDPAGGEMTERPVPSGAVTPTTVVGAGGSTVVAGAALSADGSTVAWLGAHIPAQVPTLSDERQTMEQDDRGLDRHYDEPLWRRISEGPHAPTRRVLGGGDPFAPGCPPEGTLAVIACRGPFPALASGLRGDEESNLGWLGIRGYDGVPQLSANGRMVALIGDPGGTSNAFVVDMSPGLDRVQALRRLTREVPVPGFVNPGTESEYVATAGDIYDIAISLDGRLVAFTTQRQQFPLAPPTFTEPPLSQLGLTELYQVDLDAQSLERVTHGPGDGPSSLGGAGVVTSSGASSPSYSEDDGLLAFADTASNLVSGDANKASDVFTVSQAFPSQLVGPVQIGAPPPAPSPVPQWRLSVVPVVHRDGSLTLDALIPGAGRLGAAATAAVPAAHQTGGRRRGHRGSTLRVATIAAAHLSSALGGLVELPVRVSSHYASLLGARAGLYATIRVAFVSPGGPELRQTLVVWLHRKASARRTRRYLTHHPPRKLTHHPPRKAGR